MYDSTFHTLHNLNNDKPVNGNPFIITIEGWRESVFLYYDNKLIAELGRDFKQERLCLLSTNYNESKDSIYSVILMLRQFAYYELNADSIIKFCVPIEGYKGFNYALRLGKR